MDTKKLRQKILDLAIRGKLVPQDPNDEPASVLLERIRAEKEQLIKEGKIKRSKKSAATDKSHYENVPFEIPESWCWTTIDELLINRDSERVPLSSTIRKKQVNKVYDYYGAAGVIDKVEGYLFNEKLLLIGEDGANLLSRSKDNAFFADGKYWVNNHAHVLDCCYKSILTYVAYLINSISLEPFVTGTAQPKLSQDNLNKIPIALPPIKEQARIVAGIEKWVGFIDEIETGKIELESYIKQTKSKILDLAISGKLVPQDPNDEPAIELLKRINLGFEPCDNSHYENLPQGWVKAGFKDIYQTISSRDYQIQQRDIINEGLYPVVSQSSNYIEGYYNNKEKLLDVTAPVLIFGDHTRVVKYIDFPFVIGADGVKVIKPLVNDKFAYYLLLYTSQHIENKGYSRHFQLIAKANYCIPPLREQTHIVKTIETLFETINTITAEL